jgi:RluA family pseudouridine synthase
MARALVQRPRKGPPAARAPRPKAAPPLSDKEMLSRLLYRDALILVVDKPAGLPVHAGPSGGPNLEQCFDALRFGFARPPALAHRLDRDTSGCLVLGRHPKALRKLGALFREGKVDKVYWAVVVGSPPQDAGTIDLAMRKINARDSWRMITDPAGQKSVTEYRVVGRSDGLAWLELRPRTGRTHQIRVHCAALGCPVLGDDTYGERLEASVRQPLHLHSRAVSLPLYASRPPVGAIAEPPAHMHEALRQCGWRA